MCGIIGYVGNRNAGEVAITALKRLSYRGYDSAGISVLTDGAIHTRRRAGRIDALERFLACEPLPRSHLAIGHTRWATHGEVNDRNSHPHGTEALTLVHNGIFENYLELKGRLVRRGYSFSSETDTEVGAKLLDAFYKITGDPLRAIGMLEEEVCGSYALAVIFRDRPNELYAVRVGSPLLIGLSDGEQFAASDLPAILPYTKRYFRPREREIVRLTREGVEVYLNGERVEYTAEQTQLDVGVAERGGFDHFMRREIEEQPEIARRLFEIYGKGDAFGLSSARIRSIKHITLVGCGTAYHAGLYAKTLFEELVGIPTEAAIASEFRYRPYLFDEGELAVFISQSGETKDTLMSLEMAKAKGVYALAVVNTRGSAIAEEADHAIYTHAGLEIAVASTKAYTAQCLVLALLARHFAALRCDEAVFAPYDAGFAALPAGLTEALRFECEARGLAERLRTHEHIFYIGRGSCYQAAMEGALKLKEISYIHAESYPAGELKHGTISLIGKGTPVIALIADKALGEKTRVAIREVKSRGAYTIAFAPRGYEIPEAEHTVYYPEGCDLLSPIVISAQLQLLAYHTARLCGRDIDQPRNLAKSVTVE